MILTLMWMSGSGKTRWSKKLTKRGFEHICCDDLIEEKLSPELKKLDYSGIRDVGRWIGQPYEERYQENSTKYLHFEKEILQNILNNLKPDTDHDIIIDTTGSVIHTGDDICSKLKLLTKVVYLDTPQTVQNEMFRLYLESPKPVIWDDVFEKKEGESNDQALARCYPLLLKKRSKLYEKYADVMVDYNERRDENFTVDDFLKLISLK